MSNELFKQALNQISELEKIDKKIAYDYYQKLQEIVKIIGETPIEEIDKMLAELLKEVDTDTFNQQTKLRIQKLSTIQDGIIKSIDALAQNQTKILEVIDLLTKVSSDNTKSINEILNKDEHSPDEDTFS